MTDKIGIRVRIPVTGKPIYEYYIYDKIKREFTKLSSLNVNR